jgi:hypothetical protein
MNQQSIFNSSPILRKIAKDFGAFMGANLFSRIFSKFSFLFLIFGMSFLLSGCGMISNIPSDDGSISLLAMLFGSPLEGSLSCLQGSATCYNSTLAFPVLIHAFNTGLMSAAGLIFGYVAIMGTLYTAQDGVFLGKKWSKTFIPLRAVLGVIMIFPLGSTGFGIAQYIIYAMTYAGVGLADRVWSAVATQAAPGGLSPGISLSALQGIDSALGDMVFYDTVSSVTGNSHSSYSSNLGGLKVTSAPCQTTSAQGVCVVVGPTQMTKELFETIGSSLPAVKSTTIPNPVLNFMDTQCESNNNSGGNIAPVEWCDVLLGQISSNLNNPNIVGTTSVGDIQYLVSSTPSGSSQSVGDYIQSRFQLSFSGVINGLPAPPTSIPGNTTATDPVAIASKAATQTSTTIASTSNGYNTLQNNEAQEIVNANFATDLSSIIESVLTYYVNTNPSSSSKKIEDFSNSWWSAGDEYLYLDQIFAEETNKLQGVISLFQSQIQPMQNLITVTHGGVYANLARFNLNTGSPSNTSITSCGAPSSSPQTNGCSWAVLDLTGKSLFIPSALNTYLSALQVAVASWAPSGNSPNTNAYLAGLDMICKLGGGCPTDSATITALQNYAPDPLGPKITPHAIQDLTLGPFPAIVEDLYYYFALQKFTGKSFNPQDIYQLDLGLNYAYIIYNSSYSSNPCRGFSPGAGGLIISATTSGCNPNNPGWDNPMVIAGQRSPEGDVMGFIFSGLLGAKQGSQNIAGLMAQIWCVGETNFGQCVSEIQDPTQSSGFRPPNMAIVTSHFSVIANTQWVGMNLISGSVAALTSIYSKFRDNMNNVVTKLSSATPSLGVGDWISMSIPGIGGIFSAKNSENLVDATTAATVSIASLSIALMWLPVLMIVLTTLFTTGVMFAIFIPILPFILFWAGKVAWVLLVVEAVFAAPLMALAIAYPEGHDLWGMGEQGFKISLNLLLLPVLMIVGLVAAMAITYLLLNLTASGFHYVSLSLLNMAQTTSGGSSIVGTASSATQGSSNTLVTQGIMSTFLIFMYASFISLAFNKSFSTIYVIPERVMSWIGSQGMKFGEKESGEMQGALSKQADQAAQGGGQAVSQGTQAQKGLADANVSATQQQGQSEIQMASSVGQGVSGAIQTIASVGGGGGK